MSKFEKAYVRSAPWSALSRRVVLPWALQDRHPIGRTLEIGGGTGAMALQILSASPGLSMTVTDYDPAMVEAAAARLQHFGDRVTVRQADATQLPFDDASFDTVLSFIMLHHVMAWERALAEVARVLAPGGRFIGYDLQGSRPMKILHGAQGTRHRLIQPGQLGSEMTRLPFANPSIRPGLLGLVLRFTARRADTIG
ncbi:MAG: class I SAM-dependent methyltransferase [Acidimicrobiales bacterium]